MQLENALPLMRAGNKMVRGEWEVGTFIQLVPAPEHFVFSTETGSLSPYQFTQEDILANDWELKETWNGHR